MTSIPLNGLRAKIKAPMGINTEILLMAAKLDQHYYYMGLDLRTILKQYMKDNCPEDQAVADLYLSLVATGKLML